jgi:hypothetical protein
MDHQRATLPDWNLMENLLRRLTFSEIKEHQDEYIQLLKSYITEYKSEHSFPGTAA